MALVLDRVLRIPLETRTRTVR